MTYEATAAGLRLHPFDRDWKLIPEISIHESLTGLWQLLEWFIPIKHLTYHDESTAKRWCVIFYAFEGCLAYALSLPGGIEAKAVTFAQAKKSTALSFMV